MVWKLKRALYGLKQAPRLWNKRLDEFLRSIGFKHLESEHSVYCRKSNAIIAVYVDDLLISCESEVEMSELKQLLGKTFEMKDLGSVKKLLGVTIVRNCDKKTFSLNQEDYVEKLLSKFGLEQCKHAVTPAEVGAKLKKDMCPRTQEEIEEMRNVPYAMAVGSLLYLVNCTRPDIAYAVANVSKFMQNPGRQHWIAVKRILRYLKGTSNYDLTLGSTEPLNPIGYCDSDWGGDPDDRKSTSGYLFLYGGVVSWRSRKQKTVALSSSEAEYMAATDAAKEAVWIQQFIEELFGEPIDNTTVWCDNQSCIALTKDPGHHDRNKHVEIRLHFIRNLVDRGRIHFKYCPTEEMLADGLTKSVSRITLEKLAKLMNTDQELGLSGSVEKRNQCKPILGSRRLTDNRRSNGNRYIE